MKNKDISVFGGALIVAGTSIGAGMLGLPVLVGLGGFFPALFILLSAWAFMTATGLLYAELCLYYKSEINILGMSQKTLGKKGGIFAFFIYLFMFYSLLIAYFAGSGGIIHDSWGLQPNLAILLFAFVTAFTIYKGKKMVNPVNQLLVAGLLIAYFGFVTTGFQHFDPQLLAYADWKKSLFTLPVAFTSFGYQGTVPTLASWLGYKEQRIHRAIIGGTLITLFVYVVWLALILGIVPIDGENGFVAAFNQNKDAIWAIQHFADNKLFIILGRVFAFCAISTSFLGVGIGLADFWADGLGVNQNRSRWNRLKMVILALLPPFIVVQINPSIFLIALATGGGLGAAFLLGLLPLMMSYKCQKERSLWVEKKPMLLFLFLFLLFEIFTQFYLLKGG